MKSETARIEKSNIDQKMKKKWKQFFLFRNFFSIFPGTFFPTSPYSFFFQTQLTLNRSSIEKRRNEKLSLDFFEWSRASSRPFQESGAYTRQQIMPQLKDRYLGFVVSDVLVVKEGLENLGEARSSAHEWEGRKRKLDHPALGYEPYSS